MTANITHIILDAADKCIPNKIITVRKDQPPWLTNEIKKKIRKKNRIHKIAKRRNNSKDWNKFKKIRNEVTNLVRKSKEDFNNSLIKKVINNNASNKNWWKISSLWDNFTLKSDKRYLHFSDSTQQPLPGDQNYDPLYKVKPLLTHFNTAFQQEYTTHRNIAVDETMIPFKGRVQFKQYMPQKPHKWGVKAWVLADSQHSYIQYVDIYPGRNATPQTHLGSSVVKRCLQRQI
ncbi:unnamed protein product [Mytilus coruscus]|uniref:PiggyBac transposable element-derived protein domain-containing protein n=1 Tax=Mytilus coruscus TaxID=42192 RepID=A0A6J8CFJ8_MYTCO|nr:unnamed protein product [Mytilus coruscus]